VCIVHPCCVFTDVCFVLFLFCLSTCMYIRFQVQGQVRECPRAGRFWASLLLHPTCVHSCCNWRASCVAAKHKQKNKKPKPRSTAGVPFDSVRRFWASLLLYTICVRSCCTWRASCVAAKHKINQKVKNKV